MECEGGYDSPASPPSPASPTSPLPSPSSSANAGGVASLHHHHQSSVSKDKPLFTFRQVGSVWHGRVSCLAFCLIMIFLLLVTPVDFIVSFTSFLFQFFVFILFLFLLFCFPLRYKSNLDKKMMLFAYSNCFPLIGKSDLWATIAWARDEHPWGVRQGVGLQAGRAVRLLCPLHHWPDTAETFTSSPSQLWVVHIAFTSKRKVDIYIVWIGVDFVVLVKAFSWGDGSNKGVVISVCTKTLWRSIATVTIQALEGCNQEVVCR